MKLTGKTATIYNKQHFAVKLYECICPLCGKTLWRQKHNAKLSKCCIKCVGKFLKQKNTDSITIARVVGVNYNNFYNWIRKDGFTAKDFYKGVFET